MNLWAQSIVKESLSFTSCLLKKEVRYSIYLPEDYTTSERRYPVLYLLHGWSDNETSWLQRGNMKTIVDRTIAAGKAVNMIVVMPNADITWYANSYDGKVPYEDMFFQELIPYMDKTYRTRPEQQYRAVTGLSMGGYGAFLYSVHHPEYFSSCAPLSAAIYTDEMMKEMADSVNGFDAAYGPGNVTKHWHKNSLLEIMETIPVESLEELIKYPILDLTMELEPNGEVSIGSSRGMLLLYNAAQTTRVSCVIISDDVNIKNIGDGIEISKVDEPNKLFIQKKVVNTFLKIIIREELNSMEYI